MIFIFSPVAFLSGSSDGDMEYYQKEKKGFSKEQIQYEKELEVNLFSDGEEEQLEEVVGLIYNVENIRMKTFWVEKVKGKNIVCILKREEKGKGKGIKIDCYVIEGGIVAERPSFISISKYIFCVFFSSFHPLHAEVSSFLGYSTISSPSTFRHKYRSVRYNIPTLRNGSRISMGRYRRVFKD